MACSQTELRTSGSIDLIRPPLSGPNSLSKIQVELELPAELARLSLPEGVDRRLHHLLDKQDRGEPLTDDERAEAEGLVDMADLLSLLKLRAR
jgi:hypothetical protein